MVWDVYSTKITFTILSVSSLVNKIFKRASLHSIMTTVLILQRDCNLWWLSAFGCDLLILSNQALIMYLFF